MSDPCNDPPKTLTLRLNPDVFNLLMTNAILSRVTISELVAMLAKEHLATHEELNVTVDCAVMTFDSRPVSAY